MLGTSTRSDDVQACGRCGNRIDGRYRFCPWCSAPLRSKLVEFFRPHPDIETDHGRAMRVSRYLGVRPEERHVRFSVWDEDGVAEAALSLDEAEADRLARFLLEPSGRRHRPRTVWDRLGTLRRHVH
jgi:hypothetical protein